MGNFRIAGYPDGIWEDGKRLVEIKTRCKTISPLISELYMQVQLYMWLSGIFHCDYVESLKQLPI
jgi:hypothetical protein